VQSVRSGSRQLVGDNIAHYDHDACRMFQVSGLQVQ
jgi:hypothetical protein